MQCKIQSSEGQITVAFVLYSIGKLNPRLSLQSQRIFCSVPTFCEKEVPEVFVLVKDSSLWDGGAKERDVCTP